MKISRTILITYLITRIAACLLMNNNYIKINLTIVWWIIFQALLSTPLLTVLSCRVRWAAITSSSTIAWQRNILTRVIAPSLKSRSMGIAVRVRQVAWFLILARTITRMACFLIWMEFNRVASITKQFSRSRTRSQDRDRSRYQTLWVNRWAACSSSNREQNNHPYLPRFKSLLNL